MENRVRGVVDTSPKRVSKTDAVLAALVRVDQEMCNLEHVICVIQGVPSQPPDESRKELAHSVVSLLELLPPALSSLAERINACKARLEEGLL
jgi:hypothetical protein